MPTDRQDDLRIAEQAAEWAGTLDTAGPEQQAQFVAWLRQSSRHVEEFLLCSALYRELDGVDARRRQDIEQLMVQGGANVVALGKPHLARPSAASAPKKALHSRWTIATLAACAAGIAAVVGPFAWQSLAWESFTTEIGEQRAIELADGSLIHLNTGSQIRVRLSTSGRDVQLRAGEALFTVARDPARPFRVHADRALIQALGTQFNVNRRADETKVAVIEGTVRVRVEESQIDPSPSPLPPSTRSEEKPARNLELSAGQQTSVTRAGRIAAAASADMARTVAWRQRRLVFRDDRLADVAAEFNRYNRSPRIRVEDERARERRLTGVFDANAPDSLVRFLADAEELSVDRDGDTVAIRWRFER